jgi:hypothetical protein
MTYADRHLQEAAQILQQIDHAAIERMADILAGARACGRAGGRPFFLGVGGSARTAARRDRLPGSWPVLTRTRRPTTYRT